MYDKTKFIYVGLDLHKEQHTAVIMDCFNEKLGEITFENKPSEFTKLITKCKKYGTDGILLCILTDIVACILRLKIGGVV